MASEISEKTTDINNNLSDNQDKLKLIIPYGYGDAMMICGFKDAIEKHYGVKTHFIIKKEHEVLMKLYNITDYTIKLYDEEELKEISKNQKLESGCKYVCHPPYMENGQKLFDSFMNLEINFIELYKKALSLPDDAELKKPSHVPQISSELKKKLEDIAPLDKIVLFSPESFAFEPVTPRAFELRIEELKKEGYTAISSVREKKDALKGSVYIPLTMYDALAVGINCAQVHAARSGYTDLILQFIDKLFVYYPNTVVYNIYNFNYYKDKNIADIIAEGSFLEKKGPCIQVEHKNNEKKFKFCLTLLRIKKRKEHTKYYVLGIPMWEIRYFAKYKKCYLFNRICVYKGAY